MKGNDSYISQQRASTKTIERDRTMKNIEIDLKSFLLGLLIPILLFLFLGSSLQNTVEKQDMRGKYQFQAVNLEDDLYVFLLDTEKGCVYDAQISLNPYPIPGSRWGKPLVSAINNN